MCREDEHDWVFQETQRKTTTDFDGQSYTAHFERRDCFYCKKCLTQTYKEQKELVRLPFGGIHKVSKYAPIWYQ